jgi:hypothetical protein
MVCALAGAAACGKVVDNAPDAAPSCTDGIKNGMESDVDCGGTCDGCADGKFCAAGPDCENGICNAGNCSAPSCTDGVMNGTELDVDCAGSCGAGKCKVGQTCTDNTQCESQMCAGTNVCITAKRVFVTPQLFTGGSIGGLVGADAKCQTAADAASLGGTYKAWLSDLTGSPSTRFTRSLIAPYVRTDGLVLAANWDDLTDGQLGGPINRTAANQPAVGGSACGTNVDVWTNTRTDGLIASDSLSCNNWTSNTGGSAWGRITDSATAWTGYCSGGSDFCGLRTAALYCFEQ